MRKALQNDKLLGFRRSLVDALTHPDRIRSVGITVLHEQRRMTVGDGCKFAWTESAYSAANFGTIERPGKLLLCPRNKRSTISET